MARPKSSGAGRMRKLQCDECCCILYGSASAIRDAGLPTCACGGTFTVPNMRDLVVIDPAGFQRTVDALSIAARNAIMRELGFSDSIVRKAPPRVTRQPQCSRDGCSKFRKYGARLCAQHAELETMPF